MLAQKGASVQRHLDVGGVRQRARNGHQLALTVLLARDVARHVNHLVRGALDVDRTAAARQSALQPEEEIARFLRLAIAVGHSLDQLRRAVVTAVQRLTQLLVITLVRVVPDRLTHHVNLKQYEKSL